MKTLKMFVLVGALVAAGAASAGLKGVPAVVSPEMLKTLSAMGHGDEIVIGDANFPAHTANKNVIRADGIPAADLLAAIVKLFDLDTYGTPVVMMAPLPGDTLDPAVEKKYREALGYTGPVERISRQGFYDRTKKATAVIVSGETAKYGNVLIKKGIVIPEPVRPAGKPAAAAR